MSAPRTRTLAPGPRGLELLRTISGRRTDPVRLVVQLREKYGGLVRIRLGDMRLFITSDLAIVKHVLVDNQRNYTKGPAYELLGQFLGQGLVTSEGEQWRRHRRMVQHALHRDHMGAFVTTMVQTTAEEVRRLEQLAAGGKIIDGYATMMELALRIVSRALLGGDIGGKEAEISRAMTGIFDHIERLSASRVRLLEALPGGRRLRGLGRWLATRRTSQQRAFTAAVAVLDGVIYDVIARRRSEGPAKTAGDDLVTQLLTGRDEHGAGLTNAEIRDEVMTMFVAGHETTATALAWCLHLLATHPDEQRALAVESAEVLGDRDPELGDLARLVRAQWVFAEAMRLYPPVWRISRFALEDDILGGFDLPAGSVVVIYPYLIHRDPALWESPERFDPERFSARRSADRNRLAFIPFGLGQRMCIGASFATAEAQIVLAMLARSLVFHPAGDGPIAMEPRLTLRPRGGVPLRVTAAAPRTGARPVE